MITSFNLSDYEHCKDQLGMLFHGGQYAAFKRVVQGRWMYNHTIIDFDAFYKMVIDIFYPISEMHPPSSLLRWLLLHTRVSMRYKESDLFNKLCQLIQEKRLTLDLVLQMFDSFAFPCHLIVHDPRFCYAEMTRLRYYGRNFIIFYERYKDEIARQLDKYLIPDLADIVMGYVG